MDTVRKVFVVTEYHPYKSSYNLNPYFPLFKVTLKLIIVVELVHDETLYTKSGLVVE